jgi:hypothetical protein
MGRGGVALKAPETSISRRSPKKLIDALLEPGQSVFHDELRYALTILEGGVSDPFAKATILIESLELLSADKKLLPFAKELEDELRPMLLRFLDETDEETFDQERMKKLFQGSLINGSGDPIHDLSPLLTARLAYYLVLHQASLQTSKELQDKPQTELLLAHAKEGVKEAREYSKKMLDGNYSGYIHQIASVTACRRMNALRAGVWMHENYSQDEIQALQERARDPKRTKRIEAVTGVEVPPFNYLISPPWCNPYQTMVGHKFDNIIFVTEEALEKHSADMIDYVITHEMVHLTQADNKTEMTARHQQYTESEEILKRIREVVSVDTAMMEGATEMMTKEIEDSLDRETSILDDRELDKYRFERRVVSQIADLGGRDILDIISQGPGFRAVELVGIKKALELTEDWQLLQEKTPDGANRKLIKETAEKWLSWSQDDNKTAS